MLRQATQRAKYLSRLIIATSKFLVDPAASEVPQIPNRADAQLGINSARQLTHACVFVSCGLINKWHSEQQDLTNSKVSFRRSGGMAYTSVSKTDELTLVRVQLPSSAPVESISPKLLVP